MILNYIFKIEFVHIFHKTALICAVEKRNIDIIQLLLAHDKIDANTINILSFLLLIQFIFIYINMILKLNFSTIQT